jgi:hypothetical protein
MKVEALQGLSVEAACQEGRVPRSPTALTLQRFNASTANPSTLQPIYQSAKEARASTK